MGSKLEVTAVDQAIPQGMLAKFLYKRGLTSNEAEIVSTAVITIIGVIIGKLLQVQVVI